MKPLPYQAPQRLLAVFEKHDGCAYCNLSHPDFLDWKARNTTLDSLDLPGVPCPCRARVSQGFFGTLGVNMETRTRVPRRRHRHGDPQLCGMTAAFRRQRIGDWANRQAAYLQRSMAWLAGAFAGSALLLALAGLYGAIAYSVSKRRREIGVRMALGAQTREVFRMICVESAWLTAWGIAIGLVCSALLADTIRELLFGVDPWDPATALAITAVLGVAAQLACLIPARRAASVDPAESLRPD